MTKYPTTIVDLTGKNAADQKIALDAACINGIHLVAVMYDGTNIFAYCQSAVALG